jgi:nicotinamidase/pyrazinamidase
MDPECDSYSGFRNNWNAKGERPVTGLADYLQERGITEVFLCGLARDVCVKWTAEDGLAAGFRVIFLWDATRAVDPECNDQVRRNLLVRGAEMANISQLNL